jgi:DNA-binding CsgD family transcriptional regulator
MGQAGMIPTPAVDHSKALAALILFQIACVAFFVFDVAKDMGDMPDGALLSFHFLPEIAATAGLIVGIIVETRWLLRLLRRQEMMARGLGIAAGALAELMEGYFATWGLTPSEQDVATFTIKGYAIAEIAAMRGSAEGTVKTHLNAIYRKAGVAGRGQLVSLLIEDLMRAPLVPGAETEAHSSTAGLARKA